MSIDGMTTQQKSVMLARLTGWHVREYFYNEYVIDNGMYRVSIREGSDLYKPSKMMFAWMVLNWAMESKAMVRYEPLSPDSVSYDYEIGMAMFDWLYEQISIWKMPPAEAQTAWLDKILSLAIEAGLVQLETT